jgi:hypothetical protein
MRCGNPMANRAELKLRAAQAVPDPPPSVPPSLATPYLVMVLVVAVVFLVGWGAASALQARSQQEPALQAPRTVKTDLMATTDPLPGMPTKIRDWLEHLRRTEERKNRLTAQQVAEAKTYVTKFQALGPAAGLLSGDGDENDNANPAAPAQKIATDMSAPWEKIVKEFQAFPPPPECRELADEYFSALNEVPAQMQDIQKVLETLTAALNGADPLNGEAQANKDALEQAQSLQGKSSETIDSHFINADGFLGDICAKYKTRKWFSISADFGGGLLSNPF